MAREIEVESVEFMRFSVACRFARGAATKVVACLQFLHPSMYAPPLTRDAMFSATIRARSSKSVANAMPTLATADRSNSQRKRFSFLSGVVGDLCLVTEADFHRVLRLEHQ